MTLFIYTDGYFPFEVLNIYSSSNTEIAKLEFTKQSVYDISEILAILFVQFVF